MLDNLTTRLEAKRLRMIYAAEAGSRAWGFASPDSDYDIRFVFASQRDCYLSLFDPIQDIQYQAPGALDYAGWDVKKALTLASRSNPSLCEWLGSPIIYADPVGFREKLLAIVSAHFSPKALAHHYINFMRNIRGKYMSDFMGEYTMKRYFYTLRPIFAIMWMRDNPGKLPPVQFLELLSIELPAAARQDVLTLLALKKDAGENAQKDWKSPLLDSIIHQWYDEGHQIANSFTARSMPIELLSALFRETINPHVGG